MQKVAIRSSRSNQNVRYTTTSNTIVWVQANFRVSYPNRVISIVKCIGYIGKGILNSHLGSIPDPCYIQNHVITNCVIKRFRCICSFLIGLKTGKF